jgi:hypothetical protein
MSLSLAVSSTIMTPGNKIRLEASGGTVPYTYSLAPDGDGGSILTGGYYQASLSLIKGYQTIIVTDNLGATAEKTIYILSQPQLLCQIIKTFMGLSDDQVYLYNQKFDYPKDNRIYVAVKIQTIKPFGSSSKYYGTYEELSTNVMASLSIDIMSKSMEALTRKEEVILALRSQISQRIQVDNSFKVGELPTSFTDLSQIEGSAIPYRFNISVNMHYALMVTKNTDYYENFEEIDLEFNE